MTGGKPPCNVSIALAFTALPGNRHRARRHHPGGQHGGRPDRFRSEAVLNNTSGFVMATIYDGLIRYKPGTVEVEPGLAKSWDISSDGLTYTFHLRNGVKFHDGTPFNAQRMIQTLDRQLKKTIRTTSTIPGRSRATSTSPTARSPRTARSTTTPCSSS